jgi:hypothetical protein
VNSWYDPSDEDLDDELECAEEAQPDNFCECRPGLELRHAWQHDPACRRWAPTLRGPGSTPQGRAAALAQIRSTLGARHRLRYGPPAPTLPPRSPQHPSGGTRTPPEAPRGAERVGR